MVKESFFQIGGRSRFRRGAALLLLLASIPLLSVSDSFFEPEMECATGDLDGDGRTEKYTLTDNVLTVTSGDHKLWESPREYSVDSFSLGDIDNDGRSNLLISLWKKGSFGEMRPFWHSGEDSEYKNHLFVYELKDSTLKQVWCSSNLDQPILFFEIKDVNGDGKNELFVKEGEYKKISGERYAPDPKGKVRTTVWEWEDWGFQLCDTLNSQSV